MNTRTTAPLRVAVGGLGAIGLTVARALDSGIPGLTLSAVSARDTDKAARNTAGFHAPVPIMPLGRLAEVADVVVEAVPAAAFDAVAMPAIDAGRVLMTISCGQLLPRPELMEKARETGARILVPTGALLGLDAVRAVAEGPVDSVRITTRKPPTSLEGAPYLIENGISIDGLTEPLRVFEGSARDGAKGFPANVNVAAALSLAGIGPDRTRLEIWADPAYTRNTHFITVEAEYARFEMKIENVPSEENPKTGKITAPSVIAALRGLTSTLRVGT